MFYSGTLVCPALLSLRAGTWPLMQNRLMYSRGMARRDLLILEIELDKVGGVGRRLQQFRWVLRSLSQAVACGP